MRLTFLCLVIFAGITSCRKDNLNAGSFWQCNKSQNLDTTAISSKLIGSWTWSQQSCEGMTKSADRNIKVTFSNNHMFTVDENSNILTQGTWELTPANGDWQLDMSPPSEFLYGRILFCDNQVLFNSSYIDGCDNLFDRSN